MLLFLTLTLFLNAKDEKDEKKKIEKGEKKIEKPTLKLGKIINNDKNYTICVSTIPAKQFPPTINICFSTNDSGEDWKIYQSATNYAQTNNKFVSIDQSDIIITLPKDDSLNNKPYWAIQAVFSENETSYTEMFYLLENGEFSYEKENSDSSNWLKIAAITAAIVGVVLLIFVLISKLCL